MDNRGTGTDAWPFVIYLVAVPIAFFLAAMLMDATAVGRSGSIPPAVFFGVVTAAATFPALLWRELRGSPSVAARLGLHAVPLYAFSVIAFFLVTRSSADPKDDAVAQSLGHTLLGSTLGAVLGGVLAMLTASIVTAGRSGSDVA